MSRNRILEEVHFLQGNRSEALKLAIEKVKEKGKGAELIICRDIPGPHTGGEDCFCEVDWVGCEDCWVGFW